MTSYAESIAALEDLYRHPVLPSREVELRRVSYLLDRLDHPERAFRSVHIAGSSGKGSTTAMIASILHAAGFRTGRFQSPHLTDYTERIAVNGADISQSGWIQAFDRVWPIVREMRGDTGCPHPLGRPALFEVLFAMMAVHFREAGVEWAAVETGLGGRLDATNILQSDVACITPISLEHTQMLGDTIVAIATEKAAIIKPGSSAVTSAGGEALAVIEARAREMHVPLLRVGHEIHLTRLQPQRSRQHLRLRAGETGVDVRLPLLGDFQATNAGAAFGSVIALKERGIAIGNEAIVAGLEGVSVPGRFERIPGEPEIVLDGAHHPAAIVALRQTVERELAEPVILFAAMNDKNIESMAAELGPIASAVVVTRAPGTDRAASLERMQGAFAPYVSVIAAADADEALACARQLAQGGTLLVTGSMYLVGYVRRILLRQ